MKKLFTLLLFIAICVLAYTFNYKNPQEITLDYYFNLAWTGPLVWALTAVFFIGLVMGWMLMSISVIKSKHRANKANKKLVKVEKEVEDLRTTVSEVTTTT